MGELNYSNLPPGANTSGGNPGDTYVPAAMNPDGSITPGYSLPPPGQTPAPDPNCATCNVTKTSQADSTNRSVVNYEQVSAGPVNLTHYSTPDGSLSMWAPGVAPSSTDVGLSAGSCLVSPGAGQTTSDVVGGWSVGGTATTGVGAEVSTSSNLSGNMTCAGVSGGTPGVSPTASYAMTPSGWLDALTPTPEQANASLMSIP